MTKKDDIKEEIKAEALVYHSGEPPGKLAIHATKPLANQHDLALAYSPGVAAPCEEIVADPGAASLYTGRGNLIGVVTNGTAVLGLGPIGGLAAKPVMEGKAVLFKKFSGIDVFDLEIDETDPYRLVDIIASLEPTFGGINLEDIKAPECFIVEQELKKRISIPVFHDDQHGTAIIVCAAVKNALSIVGKELGSVRLVTAGAGAAALACLDLLQLIGIRQENIIVTDIAGIVYKGRKEEMDPFKGRYAVATKMRTLAQALEGADIFLGLSAPNVLQPELLAGMAADPVILALANPVPEIVPEAARAARADAIICTGRSDYPNQVNNVLCFPYIFRGALDVGATEINDAMKLACIDAIAELTRAEPSEIVAKAYGGSNLRFGRDYLIPKPFDPRLIVRIAPAVARAAIASGVATRSIDDFKTYRQRLIQFVFKTGFLMKPVYDQAQHSVRRIAFAEGEEPRVLQAVQQIIDEHIAEPVLVGRREKIEEVIHTLGLTLNPGENVEIRDPQDDEGNKQYIQHYHKLLGRKGISPREAQTTVRTQSTVFASVLLSLGEVDAVLCGSTGPFIAHLHQVRDVIGFEPGASRYSTVTALVLPSGTFFLCDTHVIPNPGAEEIADMTLLAAQAVRQFGIKPRVALLANSNFGTRNNKSANKMRKAVELLKARDPQLMVDGEMHADSALSEAIRAESLPDSGLKGQANLLIMPNIDAANISYNLLKMLGGGVSIGPILVGAAKPIHVVSNAITVRGLVNMTALAAVEAQATATAPAQIDLYRVRVS